jgi:uncharacterized Fe-S cluster-containing radical SAM superfamily protein
MNDPIYPALQLTDACNKRCRVCLRVPGEQIHHLDRDTFFRYLEDINCVSSIYPFGFQFVTGGEPTIWKDNGMDVIDVLSALSKNDKVKSITLPTNGKLLEKKDFAEAFLERLSHSVSQTIIIGLSIAEYQDNLIDGNSKALDHLIAQTAKPGNKIFPVTLVTLSRKDETDKILKENYPDIIQRVTPLAPLGAGENELDECPSLSLAGSDKTDLGAFFPYFMKDVTSRLNISEDEFTAMPNREIMNRLSLFAHCGRSPFIDNTWHYCLPFRENTDFNLAPVGKMKANTLDEFLAGKSFLQRIRQTGVLDAVESYRDRLSRSTREKLDHLFSPDHKVSIAYRGCMICKELASLGIWEEVIDLSKQ